MEINGILGGARRFGRMSSSSNKVYKSTSKKTSSTTFEGAALQDDFYQRDVAMEYEDLDFDTKEQFNDDDVDVDVDVTGDDNLQFNETSNVDRSDLNYILFLYECLLNSMHISSIHHVSRFHLTLQAIITLAIVKCHLPAFYL